MWYLGWSFFVFVFAFSFGCPVVPAPSCGKRYLPSVELLLHPCEKWTGHIYVWSISGFLFCSVDLCVYPFVMFCMYDSNYFILVENQLNFNKTLKNEKKKLVEICFMAQDIVYLGEYSMNSWKECVFWYCWLQYSLYANYTLLVDGVVEFFYILIDSLMI